MASSFIKMKISPALLGKAHRRFNLKHSISNTKVFRPLADVSFDEVIYEQLNSVPSGSKRPNATARVGSTSE
jgi:hypothetical protein